MGTPWTSRLVYRPARAHPTVSNLFELENEDGLLQVFSGAMFVR